MHDLRHIPTETLLRRVARARAAGDWRAAEAEWWACIARAKARVEHVVDGYAHRGLVPAADRDDIVQRALVRAFRQLVGNLDDLGENAFHAAMVQVARYQCMDVGRAYAAAKRRHRPLGPPAGGGEDRDGGESLDRATAPRARADWERAEDLRELEQRLGRAIAELRDPRARVILTATRIGGVSDAELAEQVGTSVANVQQIRSRALRELAANKELRGVIDP